VWFNPTGRRWVIGTSGTVLYGVVLVDASVGVIAGAADRFLKTIDGGTSFSSFPAPTCRDLRGLAETFLDASTGWIAGDSHLKVTRPRNHVDSRGPSRIRTCLDRRTDRDDLSADAEIGLRKGRGRHTLRWLVLSPYPPSA